MKWGARFRARLRAKLHELGVRAKGAWAGWKDPQPVLRPAWGSPTEGTCWNYNLGFTRNESVLGIFITVRNELLDDPNRVVVPLLAEQARSRARTAAIQEVERRGC